MIQYNVYFTLKDDFSEEEGILKIHAFMQYLKSKQPVHDYRILKISDKVNFDALPAFHVIVDYETSEHSNSAFGFIKNGEYKKEPHMSLMTMTKDFKISFSEDV